jgi:hypothetical protein
MSIPQSVTIRYATNLLLEGENDSFVLDYCSSSPNIVNGDVVGQVFKARVFTKSDLTDTVAFATTPRLAVKRALEKHGVAFI